MDIRFRWLPVLLLTLTLSGCDLIGDILEFGFWVGVILILIVVGLVVWVVRMFRS